MPRFPGTNSARSTIRVCVSGVIAAFAITCSSVFADGETDFVRQLLSRSLFRTAEDYCEQNQTQATDINVKAEWEQLLSDCYSAHAWVESAENRSGLMERAIEHITEFLQQNVVHPERELRLRLRQIELLIQAIRMQDHVEQSGHLMIRPIAASLSRNPDYVKSRTEFLRQARELTDGLLQQLEEIRSDLDATSVRHLRERARIASAEISVLQSMTILPSGVNNNPAAALEAADGLIRQLSRSVSDEDLKFLVAYLGAEVPLLRRDFKEFELRQGVLEGLATTSQQKASAAAIAAMGLLQQRQPTIALALIADQSTNQFDPQILCMEFECLLAVYETTRVLSKPDLQTAAEDQFRGRLASSKNRLQGVWLESATRIERRFELVQRYGSEAAEHVAIADQLERQGKLLEASQSLERLLSPSQAELPGNTRALTALKAGELYVRMKNWQKARELLEVSRSLSLSSNVNDSETAAAADLLNIFCLSQTMIAASDETEYLTALEQHLARYPDSVTVPKAREWLAQFQRQRSPQLAALQYLALFQSRSEARPLIECGRILSSPGTLSDKNTQADVSTRESFRKAVAIALSLESISVVDKTELEIQAIEIQIHEMNQLNGPSPDAAAEWQRLDESLRRLADSIQSQLADISSNSETAISITQDKEIPTRLADLQKRAALGRLIVTACTQPASDLLIGLQKQLLDQTETDRERTALILHSFYVSRTSGVGNDVIASTITQLLRESIARIASSSDAKQDSPMDLMQLFEIQAVASQRTGNMAARDKLLTMILNQRLSQQQLMRAAQLMSHDSPIGETSNQSDALKRFWKTVLKNSSQGSEVWLEASLQAAQFSLADNQPAEANRILGIVEALYPEWGQEDRRRRADELRKKLEEQKP